MGGTKILMRTPCFGIWLPLENHPSVKRSGNVNTGGQFFTVAMDITRLIFHQANKGLVCDALYYTYKAVFERFVLYLEIVYNTFFLFL